MSFRNKSDWWQAFDDNWDDLLAICKRVGVDLDRTTHSQRGYTRKDDPSMRESRDGRLVEYLQRAWERATDIQEIHSWPAWGVLCDLCSAREVLEGSAVEQAERELEEANKRLDAPSITEQDLIRRNRAERILRETRNAKPGRG